jgi:UDP-N-acetylglucosamine 2-epimerase (non-hydrolysing)
MKQKLKVMTVVGTRPEIIRLSRVIARLDEAVSIEHILVHTGQNYDYELNGIFFVDMGIRKPDYFLEAAGKTATETIGNLLIKIDPLLESLNPDAILILGDTNSCLSAIPAKKRKIPIFHMEAGNRCFDQRVPEETKRKIVDHISDINLTYTDIARDYLLREGFPADRIMKTGSPMFEVLNHHKEKILNSDILSQLNLKKGEYFVVSAHREENINSSNFDGLIRSLNIIAETYKYPIIFSTHPRTLNMINSKGIVFHDLIQILKPMDFTNYNALQCHSAAVLSDSGTISEESSILKFRALNIRDAHERPEAMEEAAVILTGTDPERIMQSLALLLNPDYSDFVRDVADYNMPNVSDKVVKLILSYTTYVNRVVWSKINC